MWQPFVKEQGGLGLTPAWVKHPSMKMITHHAGAAQEKFNEIKSTIWT